MSKLEQIVDYPVLSDFDLMDESPSMLSHMQQGVDEMIAALEQAAGENYHLLTSVLNADDNTVFTEWDHYPKGDVHDKENGSIWFYHAHSEDEGARPWTEHGHFHLFGYTELIEEGTKPIALPEEPDYEKGGLCHLAAVSFDHSGLPIRIFTTNRWVTNEWLYPAEQLIPLLDKFAITNEKFSITSKWLMALLKLYRPQIEWAMRQRDETIEKIRALDPEGFAENKSFEVLSAIEFDLAAQIDRIEAASA